MSTHIWNSAVIEAPVSDVWAALRSFTFAFKKGLSAQVEEKKSASEVGAIVRLTYPDKTVQRIKIVEISDLAHTVAWDLIESIPHVSVLAATHTVKLKRVTENNTTFIEWATDFSKDVDAHVTADAGFKQKENFDALNLHLAKPAPVGGAGGLIGGMKVIYSKEKAAEGVQKVFNELKALNALNHAELAPPAFVNARKQYLDLPVTYQLDWAVADINPATAQQLADAARERLNARGTAIGFNGLPLPRLFNAT